MRSALMDYQDQAYATRRGSTLTPKPGASYQTVQHTRELTAKDHAFLQTISRVRDAFDIDAFSSYPEGYPQTLSEEVYEEDMSGHTPDERITWTSKEKGILQKIQTLAVPPDAPPHRPYPPAAVTHTVYA